MTRGLNRNHSRLVKEVFKAAATAATARPGALLPRHSPNHRPFRRTRRSVRPAHAAESQIEPWFAPRDPSACLCPVGPKL
jgi:hypothetical protein